MERVAEYAGCETGPLLLSGGLGFGLLFAEALGPKIQGHAGWISVSAIRDGLLFLEEIQGRAVRITENRTAGCGRMYLGDRTDFDFETKLPREGLGPVDWCLEDLPGICDQALVFLLEGKC